MKIRALALAIFLVGAWATPLKAVLPLASATSSTVYTHYIVTVENLELKNAAGEWVSVVRPDKQVDLLAEEASVSFFNNGRIPPGDYVNFRLSLLREVKVIGPQGASRLRLGKNAADNQIEWRAKSDLEPLKIKKGTFINVTFAFDFKEVFNETSSSKPPVVDRVELTVDQNTLTLGGQDTVLEL